MTTATGKREAIESLRTLPLFSALTELDLAQIASHVIERRYPRNTTIVEEGLPGDYMYVIREGRVKVTKLSEDGREKILELLEGGDFFGEMALLDREPRSASVKTLEPARLLALSRADFLDVLRRNPDVAVAVIQELSRRLRWADEQTSALSFHRVKDRAQALLRRLAREPRESGAWMATNPITHQQIAEMIGTSRETVTRVVKELKQEAWLRQDGKRYLVPAES
jgi:CRP-like cAMP-binding protein